MATTHATLTIDLPEDVLLALQREPDDFAREARVLLALKLYEDGRLTTGLAARLAGIPRSAFIAMMGQHGLSPFGYGPDELDQDLDDVRSASR